MGSSTAFSGVFIFLRGVGDLRRLGDVSNLGGDFGFEGGIVVDGASSSSEESLTMRLFFFDGSDDFTFVSSKSMDHKISEYLSIHSLFLSQSHHFHHLLHPLWLAR